MSRTSTLSYEPVTHMIYALVAHDEPELAYSLLEDYAGAITLSDEELARTFEVLVTAGYFSDAKVLLDLDIDWTTELETGPLDTRPETPETGPVRY